MLTIIVELLAGTIRSTSADDLAITGELDTGEWPPSPARLFAAFVAADGTGERCRLTSGEELKLLERADPPVIVADPLSDVCRTPLENRFVVVNKRQESTTQEYPARQVAEVRLGSRLSPRTPRLWFAWPDLDLDASTVDALRVRAARISYLGCADSPVRVSVSDEAPPDDAPTTWLPTEEGGPGCISLPVAFPGLLEALDAAFERFTSGEVVRRAWLPSLRRWYTPGTEAAMPPRPEVIWLRFDRPLPGRSALAATEALRSATLELYDRWAATSPGDLPPVLLGHGYSGAGFQHVHWLALPDVGHRFANGRLYGAAVWLPPGTPADIVVGVRRALGHLSELVTAGGRSTPVRLYDGAARPVAATPGRWVGPSRLWATVFPVVHERWGRVDLAQVATWCRHAGLPEPVDFASADVPFVEGGAVLRPDEVHRQGRERRPYSHLVVEFSEPITGPVMLGRGRQFGMGLALPVGRISETKSDRRHE
ncbi:MAG: type I-U CRISPR-associated protein Csb2 [Actinomycetota bacterium]|nr:type I-U CRISPR-associated protein Csb2 [Actinomycetota bacterium]